MCILMASFFPHLFVSAYQTDWGPVTLLVQQQHLRSDIGFKKKKMVQFGFVSFLIKVNLDHTTRQVLRCAVRFPEVETTRSQMIATLLFTA